MYGSPSPTPPGLARSARLAWAAAVPPTLSGLVASAALLVDYVRPAPVFCDGAGPCEAVRHAAFASILGVPTPIFGVAAFLAIGALAFLRGARARLVQLSIALMAAAFAIVLIVVQATIHQFCPFCVVTDMSAILVAAACAWRFAAEVDRPEGRLAPLVVAPLLVVALVAPLALGFTRTPSMPAVIAHEIARSARDQATVVDFVDFECPFCRMTHENLAPVLEASRAHVRLVRKQVPLSRIHPHALDAARAACCGEQLGKGDEMADALFRAPVRELTREGCEKLAQSLGIDAAAFHACVDDPETAARIQRESNAFKASNGHGLPTIWIGAHKFEGLQEAGVLEQAVRDEIQRRS